MLLIAAVASQVVISVAFGMRPADFTLPSITKLAKIL